MLRAPGEMGWECQCQGVGFLAVRTHSEVLGPRYWKDEVRVQRPQDGLDTFTEAQGCGSPRGASQRTDPSRGEEDGLFWILGFGDLHPHMGLAVW